jgi:hypothetical protein
MFNAGNKVFNAQMVRNGPTMMTAKPRINKRIKAPQE